MLWQKEVALAAPQQTFTRSWPSKRGTVSTGPANEMKSVRGLCRRLRNVWRSCAVGGPYPFERKPMAGKVGNAHMAMKSIAE
jgi:hypothetical protein